MKELKFLHTAHVRILRNSGGDKSAVHFAKRRDAKWNGKFKI